MSLPHPTITRIPNNELEGTPSLWNTRYEEIDANFSALGQQVNAADAAVLVAANAHADSLVVGLWDDRGSFNASINTYPTTGGSGTDGAILKGDIWTISVVATSGPLNGLPIGSAVRAVSDAPGQTAANWSFASVGYGYVPENASSKDVSGGYVGLTLLKINFWNALGTVKSFFANSNTAARTYTFQDRTGTIAHVDDIPNATAKTTTVDADSFGIWDSVASTLKQITFANLKATLVATANSWTAKQTFGDVEISGTGKRITGDFSNGTLGNRAAFQSSTANGNSIVAVLPNGTSFLSGYDAFNNTDPTNCGRARFNISSALNIEATISGTGTYVPINVYTGGIKRLEIGTDGSFLVNGAGNMPGYKNILINGNFNIRQRPDDTSAASQNYVFDRWAKPQYQAGKHTLQEFIPSGTHPGNSKNAFRVSGDGSSSVRLSFGQGVEYINTIQQRGKTITAAVWLKFSAASLHSETASDFYIALGATTSTPDASYVTNNYTLTSSQTHISQGSLPTVWTRYSVTYTVPLDATNIGFCGQFTSPAVFAANEYYEVSQAICAEGSVAPTFETPPYQIELAQCQRYYELIGLSASTNTRPYTDMWQLKVEKRASPTLSVAAGTAYGFSVTASAYSPTSGFRCYTTPTQATDLQIAASAEL